MRPYIILAAVLATVIVIYLFFAIVFYQGYEKEILLRKFSGAKLVGARLLGLISAAIWPIFTLAEYFKRT